MCRWLCGLAVVAFALAMPGCKSAEEVAKEKEAAEKDQKAMAGKWKLTRAGDGDGDGDGEGEIKTGEVITIDGNVMKRPGNYLPRQKMTLHATKDPKQIEMVAVKEDGSAEQREYTVWVSQGKNKPKKPQKRTGTYKRNGLYKIEGDTLTICLGYDDKRPSELSSGPDRELFVYKRVGAKNGEGDKKPEDKKPGDKKPEDKKPEKKDDK